MCITSAKSLHLPLLPQSAVRAIVLASLALCTLWVYWPARNFSFVNYDDDEYVYDNPRVLSGLTLSNVCWALCTTSAANWHPVTWLSLMLDRDLYGQAAGGYHFTNVCLHIFNALLLFWVLLNMTGALWRSAFVAFLFALHPLHVESVAWISERKDLLCTFFMLLSLWTYWRYARTHGAALYVRTLIYFALGLMAKPMIVTVPLILLLLDYWPLNRLVPYRTNQAARSQGWRLIVEKIPFAVLSAAACVVTLLVQKTAGSMTAFPLGIRLSNAILSYVRYIAHTAWPVHLAFFYPLTVTVNMTSVVVCGCALVGISYAAVRAMRTAPWFFVGWFFYVVTLLPVIGIVRVGSQSMADRYTYLPLIGLFVIAAWGIGQLVKGGMFRRIITVAGAALLLAVVSVSARQQVGCWQDSTHLFRHALAVTNGNYLAHNNLGKVLYAQNMPDSALVHFSEALKILPDYPAALYNAGFTVKEQGKLQEALPYLRKAVLLDSNYAHAFECLGETYEMLGLESLAVATYRRAISCQPDVFAPWFKLSVALCNRGSLDSAIICLDSALLRLPASWEAHYYLAVAYLRKHNADSSFFHIAQALRLNPCSWKLNMCLGEELFRSGRISSAIRFYSRAIRLAPDSTQPRLDRGTAFAIHGDLDSAIWDFKGVLARNPGSAQAHYYLGQIYARSGMQDSALFHARLAKLINPNYPGFAVELGPLFVPQLHSKKRTDVERPRPVR
jgi:tetratricopeptide (TPR) repeat protein